MNRYGDGQEWWMMDGYMVKLMDIWIDRKMDGWIY